MAAQHWDVSRELRDPHGQWSRGGQVLHRLAKEAAGGRSQAPHGFEAGHKVRYKTGATGTIHHIDEKGVPHVVWDKGRGKPVRTPAHHLEHHSEQVKPAERPPGSVEHKESALTPGEEKIREQTFRKLASKTRAREPRVTRAMARSELLEKRKLEEKRRTEEKKSGPQFSGDIGFTPGRGVGGRYRGAKKPEYYQGLSEPELENLVRSQGSQAAQDELTRRRFKAGAAKLREQRLNPRGYNL